MARRRHNDRALYVVSWDEAGFIKIGFSDHLTRRLRAFPGARLILTLTFPTSLAAYEFEVAAHRVAFPAWPQAFASRKEAEAYFDGVGFRECYRVSPAEALDLIASQCDITMRRHNASSQCDVTPDCHTVMSRSYGRTDGLTENCGFRDAKIYSYVTRVRAGQFLRIAGFGRAS